MKSLFPTLVLTLSLSVLQSVPCFGSEGVSSTSVETFPAPAPELPEIQLTREGTQVRIEFTGQLQSALDLKGPWLDLAHGVSPLFLDTPDQHRFFRSVARDSGPIFSSSAVVNFTLAGPLQTHFGLAAAGAPDGIFPPVRLKPYFDGVLQIAGAEILVTLRVRGNSSLQECPFPKLKFKVSKEQRAGTPFAEAREIKIGTHCAEGGRGNIGRLRDERATFREALAYEAMQILGFVSPRVRRASIEFRDTSVAKPDLEVGWSLTRKAFLLEAIDVIAERLGGVALTEDEIAALKNPRFDLQLITDLEFFHAMLGNWDYALSTDGQSFSNTDLIQLADGSYLPVAGDLDLSSWVTEVVRSGAPRDYHPGLPAIERNARFELERIHAKVDSKTFAAARDRFLAARTRLESQVAGSEIDDAGRENAAQHLAAFYKVLALF